MADMVFLDAWGDDAARLASIAQRGALIKITNPKVVDQRPQYSTSPLRYFLRIQGPLNTLNRTRVEVMSEPGPPWSLIPMYHPFVDISNLERVEDNATLCVLVVVVAQPGKVSRVSQYGAAEVCNAVVRQKETTIRCAFWRKQADVLSSYPEGTCLAMYQVRVVKVEEGEWELRASESTAIEECPAELADRVRGETDLSQAATQALTRASHASGARVDYARAAATPACVGALMSLLVAECPRTIDGVWELHGVTALGLAPVLHEDSYFMVCCEQCKRQVDNDTGLCAQHPDAAVENRWIGKLNFADDTGAGDAMIYHEALEESGMLPRSVTGPLTPANVLAMKRRVRGTPWSLRMVYRTHETRQQTYYEIKKITPLLTEAGVVATWQVASVPEVLRGATCPFAKCAHVRVDTGLGGDLRGLTRGYCCALVGAHPRSRGRRRSGPTRSHWDRLARAAPSPMCSRPLGRAGLHVAAIWFIVRCPVAHAGFS